MSIASELSTLAANKAAIKAAIEAKNPATPPTGDMSQWPTSIASIPSGGGGGGMTGYTLTIYGTGGIGGDKGIAVLFADATIGVYETYEYLYDNGSLVLNDVVGYHKVRADGGPFDQWVTLSGDTTINMSSACLLAGTKILLADGSAKNVEDVGYDDDLRVWDFERGELAVARPLWIMRPQPVGRAYRIRFEEGVTLNVTGPHGHRAYNVDLQRFEYLPRSVGDRVWTLQGYKRVTGCELREVSGDCYNIITAGHLNIFANGVLTSCRLNNYRKFSGRDLRFAEHPTTYHPASDFDGIPEAYVSGLHLCEQPAGSDELRSYVARLLATEVD